MSRQGKADRAWSDEDLALLQSLATGECADIAEVRDRLEEELAEHFTLSQVQNRLKRIGIMADDVKKAHLLAGTTEAKLVEKLKALQAQVKGLQSQVLRDEEIRSVLGHVKAHPPEPPTWLVETRASQKGPGVPVLLGTDWHWGEVVDPAAINGVNEYNMAIARERARRLITRAIDLLQHHIGGHAPKYPGIVFALDGDMFSGNIHEELRETNEAQVYACLLDLLGVLIWCIETLADAIGHVFVPCEIGNHSRGTDRVRYKGSVKGSLDWLLYALLDAHFKAKNGGKGDPRVVFLLPSSTDLRFQVYVTRFLLTHGNQFRGGDGIIGCLGPIFRGDVKKRARNGQIDQGYDTMVLGHFHQDIRLRRVIVGGSLVGYNEYAHDGNFGFEPPSQPLWLVHPEHGITISAPVFVEEAKKRAAAGSWVAWQEVA